MAAQITLNNQPSRMSKPKAGQPNSVTSLPFSTSIKMMLTTKMVSINWENMVEKLFLTQSIRPLVKRFQK